MRFSNIYSKVRFIPQVHLFLLDHGTALDYHVIPLVVVPVMCSLTLSLQLVLASNGLEMLFIVLVGE
jgi:hypothetical protein